MEISNIFPEQPDKIDVGSPVRINWFFKPNINRPVTLSITNNANGVNLYERVFHNKKVIIPVKLIPKRKTVRFKVKVPVIRFNYKGKETTIHKDSSLIIHIQDEKVLHTFG